MGDPFPNLSEQSPPRTVEWLEGFINGQIDKRLQEIQTIINSLQEQLDTLELEKRKLLIEIKSKIGAIKTEKEKHERLLARLSRIQEKIEEEVLNKTISRDYLDTLNPLLTQYGVDVSYVYVDNTYSTSGSIYRDENEDNLKLKGEENYGRE